MSIPSHLTPATVREAVTTVDGVVVPDNPQDSAAQAPEAATTSAGKRRAELTAQGGSTNADA